MKVLAVAGDVGGARAIMPVLERLCDVDIPFAIVDHGFLGKNAPAEWPRKRLLLAEGQNSLGDAFGQREFGALVFATSVQDSLPLSVARLARRFCVPVICLLDNWMNYRKRLEVDDFPLFCPDAYAVMDDLAFEEAVADGIPKSVLKVTGQPALSLLSEELRNWASVDRKERLKSLGLAGNKRLLVFISEPVETDQGAGSDSPQFRGYTEKTVLRQLCYNLNRYSDEVQLVLVPHPREDPGNLTDVWKQCQGDLDGGLLQLTNGREAVFLSDGVSGMASILLYEAWLIGKPVISLQPGLQRSDLSFMSKKNGCYYLTDSSRWESTISQWLTEVKSMEDNFRLRKELQLHVRAPEKICEIIISLLEHRQGQAATDTLVT